MAKRESMVDIALLEHCLREDLNRRAKRVMAVLRPLKVVIENYPEDRVEMLDAINNPEDETAGTRQVPFSRVIYIEQEDFREEPPKKYFRLSPGVEVRLKYAYLVKCVGVIKDETSGEIVEVRCTYDPDTKSGAPAAERRVKGTLHWVSAAHAFDVEARLYDHLFTVADPLGEGGPYFKRFLNPKSVEVLKGCKAEPSLCGTKPGEYCQFLRQGYFSLDSVDSRPGALVFNGSVGLRDTWAKIQKAQKGGELGE
jgi:glutaminyl-tRNA synthetase